MSDFTKCVKLCVVGALVSGQVYAVDPVLNKQVPQDGVTYTLMNLAQPNQYMMRTSWDGAYYLMSWTDVNGASGRQEGLTNLEEAYLKAKKNSDGTWSFVRVVSGEDEEDEYYFDIPANTGNVNSLEMIQAKWNLIEGDEEGYYKLQLAETVNNDLTQYGYLHLNNGAQYVVITYQGNSWFPDAYGGIEEADDTWEGAVTDNGQYKLDEHGLPIFKNTISLNWAFVLPEDITTYASLMNVTTVINAFENDYAETEDYGEGATKIVAAATELYNADKGEEAVALITNARALINAIDAAKDAADDGSLSEEIDAAQAVLNANGDLAAAAEKLNEQVNDFKLGKGDVTSKGVNMSFEDLSNQGGSQSTGVTNAPAGWNLYLNGALCNEASQISAAGVANWCSINDDCEGEAKDGNYGFGIWTSSMPKVELSQTITGLASGTYSVTAGVMVGANGNGSRMTTQRIFANNNSTYFGSEEQYVADQLDQSEVYGFQGNEEPVTDRLLQDVTVRAFVYDGTLTFGFRTDNNVYAVAGRTGYNGAGGDGWFKVDNFRLMYEGLDMADARAILDNYAEKINNLLDEKMQESVKENAENVVDAYNNLDDDAAESEVTPLIASMKDAIEAINASVSLYNNYFTQITSYEEKSTDLASDSRYQKSDIAALDEELGVAYTAYDDAELDEEGINAELAKLEAAYKAVLEGSIAVGSDITNVIINPSFEEEPGGSGGVNVAPKGWTIKVNGVECSTVADLNAQGLNGWCDANGGDGINVEDENNVLHTQQPTDGDFLWGIWNTNMPEVELSQTLNLPQGTYVVTADVMVQYDWAFNNVTTQRIFGNDYVQMFGEEDYYTTNLPEDALAAKALDEATPDASAKFLTYAGYNSTVADDLTSLLRTLSVTFGVGEDGVAKIGFRTNGVTPEGVDDGQTAGQGWFKVDNFTLYYQSEAVPTGVESVAAGKKLTKVQSVEYYTVDGARVAAPVKGVNVVKARLADGSVVSSKFIQK
jgi:hypothetical protein